MKNIIVVVAFLISACSFDDKNGQEYIGHWVSGSGYQTLDITRNGGNKFIIIRKPGSSEVPALYKNGQLEAHGGLQVFVIENATGQLTSGNRIYSLADRHGEQSGVD